MRLPIPALATLPSLLVPAAVVLVVWLPVVAHHSVANIAVSASIVDSARRSPSDAVLLEARNFNLLRFEGRGQDMEIDVAEGILQGRLSLPGAGDAPINVPFSPDDLDGLPAEVQLPFAAYVVPDFLLAAYVATQREDYFAMAHDAILAWDDYERSAWPKGYLWNDHATAARVLVLAEFWGLYRQRPDYQADTGRIVLEQAARYRAFLSDPARFTFASNHGLMQNLALLHLELAFPALPDSPRYRELALERIGQQLQFLMDDEGVVRENSAGYQGFGLEVLGMTFRTMTLLGEPIPDEWKSRYEEGLRFQALLQRPDGTLPATGDTDGSSRTGYPRVTQIDRTGEAGVLHAEQLGRPAQDLSVHPGAGYWIEWDGLGNWPDLSRLSQTVVTWTRPPGPGHKHADELSVLIWSKGVSWLTSVGYWPYGEPGRAEAESWIGANAPHLANEGRDSERTARLLSSGSSPSLSAIDLERRGPGSFVARRQVVHVKPDLWLVVDHVEADHTEGSKTVWTLSPEVESRRDGSNDSYMLDVRDHAAAARIFLLGSPGTRVRDYQGSVSPFAGWHVVQSVPQPAPAITVEQPAGEAWTVAVLSTASPGSALFYAGERPEMSSPNAASAWTITLQLATGELRVARENERITVQQREGDRDTTSALNLTPAPDVSLEHMSMRAAFDTAAAAYPIFQERGSARTRVTAILAGLVLAQEAFLLMVRRWRRRLLTPFRIVIPIAWIGVGMFLQVSLLRSWEVFVLP